MHWSIFDIHIFDMEPVECVDMISDASKCKI